MSELVAVCESSFFATRSTYCPKKSGLQKDQGKTSLCELLTYWLFLKQDCKVNLDELHASTSPAR